MTQAVRCWRLAFLALAQLALSACPASGPAGADGGSGPSLYDAGAVVEPGDAGTAEVSLRLRSDRSVRPISPWIYGTNSLEGASQIRPGALRLGGNRWTAYNWENNASNAGADWNYQNDNYLAASSTPGAAVKPALEIAATLGAATLLTVPILDRVAADTLGDGDVRNSGANYLQTRFHENRASGGSAGTSPDPNDGAVYQNEYIQWVKAKAQSQAVLFSLDNEPDLWRETHPEIHPDPVRYDELVARNTEFAQAIKQVWPQAAVTGFVSYGWNGFTTLQGAPDGPPLGDFTDHYLAEMKKASDRAGQRLVDYLDLHWYSEARGGGIRIIGTETSEDVVEARLQAPRSLWDPTYVEDSWIAEVLEGKPIRLLPRMFDKIARHNPGTQLAITEWNFGAGDQLSGGLAAADALGIFGREGVGLATLWKLQSRERYSDAALRLYRNFDNLGGHFGNHSVEALSSDPASVTVYASVDTEPYGQATAVVINKSTEAKVAVLSWAHGTALQKLRAWALTDAGPEITKMPAIEASATSAFRLSLPPRSAWVFRAE